MSFYLKLVCTILVASVECHTNSGADGMLPTPIRTRRSKFEGACNEDSFNEANCEAFLQEEEEFMEQEPLGCGTLPASRNDIADLRYRVGDVDEKRWTTLSIPVVYHVLHFGEFGMVTEDAVRNQLDIVNAAFNGSIDANNTSPAHIQFYLHEILFVESLEGYRFCHSEMKTLVRPFVKDPKKFVNIFTCSGEGFLGWTFNPWVHSEGDLSQSLIINYRTLPGGSLTKYNLGFSTVHELGHYFGLLHTFGEGGCSETGGDGVSDTPLEALPMRACELTRDSCPGSEGLDPVWNFMDYSVDSCMQRFTPGQIERMHEMITLHRPSLIKNSIIDVSSVDGDRSSTNEIVLPEIEDKCNLIECGYNCVKTCGWSTKKKSLYQRRQDVKG